jgi:hypothetical protein
MDGTWKGVDKPGGAHYYTPPSSENPINDCPGCKYGTLEATPDKTIKCIDCDREYTPGKHSGAFDKGLKKGTKKGGKKAAVSSEPRGGVSLR